MGEDYISPKGRHVKQWLCKCDCGSKQEVLVSTTMLKNGNTKSCGCLQKETVSKQFKKYNTYEFINNDYGIGYTFKKEEFYFDLEDYDLIKDYCWYIDKDGYVCSNLNTENKKHKTILMHRLILGLTKREKEADHINHYTSDNRKSNLRPVTRSQNSMNKSEQINNTSGYKGVNYNNKDNYWYSFIWFNKKYIYLGSYNNKKDAIKVRLEAENKYFKEYEYKNCNNTKGV